MGGVKTLWGGVVNVNIGLCCDFYDLFLVFYVKLEIYKIFMMEKLQTIYKVGNSKYVTISLPASKFGKIRYINSCIEL